MKFIKSSNSNNVLYKTKKISIKQINKQLTNKIALYNPNIPKRTPYGDKKASRMTKKN